jgi:hypothetical protein
LTTRVAAGRDVEAASDHRPVAVDLWLGPARPGGGMAARRGADNVGVGAVRSADTRGE